MRKKERINRFFNKVNQEFFICKKHLMSCESIPQASAVTDWAANLNNKWDNEIHMLVDNISSTNYLTYVTQYNDLNDAMAKEWTSLRENKVSELNPQPRKEEEKKYPPIVVVKGFQ